MWQHFEKEVILVPVIIGIAAPRSFAAMECFSKEIIFWFFCFGASTT